jgi:hypothetical protein
VRVFLCVGVLMVGLAIAWPQSAVAQTTEMPEAESLTLVSRARISAVYDFEVVPPYAYALERGILRVLDVSDPDAVHEVGSLSLGLPRIRMAMRHPYLYLSGFGAPVGIVDVSDPVRPRWVGEWEVLADIWEDVFEVAGDAAYLVAGSPPSLRILDLEHSPTQYQPVGEVALGDYQVKQINDVAYAEGRVYVLVQEDSGEEPRNRLIAIDVSSPEQPLLERSGSLPAGRRFRDVKVRDELMYVTERSPRAGLAVFRWGEGEDPELLGSAFDEEFWFPVELIVHGQAAYVTFKGNVDVAAFDVSDPTQPRIVHTHVIPDAWAAGLYMTLVGERLYVAGDGGWAPMFDVSTPLAPRLLGHWQFEGGWACDVVRDGNLALVVNMGGGLVIHDITDPGTPTRLARLWTHGPSFEEWQWNTVLTAKDGRAVMAFENLPAEILDLKTPTHPQLLGRFQPSGMVQGIALTSESVFLGYREVAEGETAAYYDPSSFTGRGGIEVFDLANPGAPERGATLRLDRSVTDLALQGDRLVAAHLDGGLSIVDVSDVGSPTLLGSLDGGGQPGAETPAWRNARVALSDDGALAFLATTVYSDTSTFRDLDFYTGDVTLAIVDIEDPVSPRVLGLLGLRRQNIAEISVVARGRQAILFTGDIVIVDAADPIHPTVVFQQDFPPADIWVGDGVGLALDDQHLYLGAAEDGLWLYLLPPDLRR